MFSDVSNDLTPLRFFKNVLEYPNCSKFVRVPNLTFSTISEKNLWGKEKNLLYKNRSTKMFFFGVKEFFFVDLNFKKGCENEFQDYKEKSCS